MGVSSFDCSTCGSHEQFDWTDHVVVALKNVKTDEVVHVLGKYDAYGGVSINLCEGAPGKYDAKGRMTVSQESDVIASIQVYHKQFGSRTAPTVTAEEIYCFGAVNGCSFGCGEGLGTRPKVKKAKNKGPPRSVRKDEQTDERKDEREDCDGEGRERDHHVEDKEEEEEEEGEEEEEEEEAAQAAQAAAAATAAHSQMVGYGMMGGYGMRGGGMWGGGMMGGGMVPGMMGGGMVSGMMGMHGQGRMSLLDDNTHQRPDDEVLPLITKTAARQMDSCDRTPLHYAAQNFSFAVVQALLVAYPEAAKEEDWEGDTPLHLAAKYSSEAVVQSLLAAYPKAARVTNRAGSLPLHLAAKRNPSVAVVQALLAAYPDAAQAMEVREPFLGTRFSPSLGTTPADYAKNNPNAEVKAFFASGKHLDGGSSSTAPPPPEEEEEEPWVRMCVPCDIEVYSALPQIFAEKLPVYEKDYKALGKAGLKKILGAPESWGMGPLEEMRMMKKMMRMKERAARRAQG